MLALQQLNPSSLDVERAAAVERTPSAALSVTMSASVSPSKANRASSAPVLSSSEFTVQWKNLTYVIDRPTSLMSACFTSSSRKRSKTILSSLSGQIQSGELMALMGPSGAGKSTLLECIASIRRRGRFGEVLFIGQKKVNMAFIPQKDNFFTALTVREALIFASKFQNSAYRPDDENFDDLADEAKDDEFHDTVVEEIITKLGLEVCANVRIAGCSGGQLKRLSIAQELVAKPQILILDEPTSGLDSSTCYQTVDLLHKLTQEKPSMAIIATIHQPSAKVFNLFHKVYALSSTGKCIYEGPPGNILVDHLRSFKLDVPQFSNPADFLIDIASGEYGRKLVTGLALDHEKITRDILTTVAETGTRKSLAFMDKDLDDMIINLKFPFFTHVAIHTRRSMVCSSRDPMLFFFRFLMHIGGAVFLGLLYSHRGIGQAGGCPPPVKDTSDPTKFQDVQEAMEEQEKAVFNNLGFWFFNLVFLQFAALMPTVLTFPTEISSVAKERTNGWYSILTYYIGKTIADIPLQVLAPLLYLIITYLMTSQPLEWQRFLYASLPVVLMCLVAQCQGLIVGGLFCNNLLTAVFLAPSTSVPLMLFSGFFIKIDYIPDYFRPGIYISYIRYAFEAVTLSIYGYARCGASTVETVVTINQRMTLFLSNVFRIAFSDEDDDGTDEKYQQSVRNMTTSMVNGIVNQLAGKIETVEGTQVVGVLADFKITESMYSSHILALVLTFVLLRIYGFYVIHSKATVTK